MARRGVDGREEANPLYAAAAILFDVGVIVGAHKTATTANAIQKKLSTVLQDAMEDHEFTRQDWGVFYHGRAQGIEHVWYIECSSAGVHEAVATKLKDYEFMLLPGELTVPADKLNRLQKEAIRFVKEAEEKMEVKDWNGGELAQMARKAYKTAQLTISAKIDERLLDSFCIGGVWEMATLEQRRKRGRMSGTMRHQEFHSWHEAPPGSGTRAIMPSPDEAGAWSDDMKGESFLIKLTRFAC
jgi:hypothetical protein